MDFGIAKFRIAKFSHCEFDIAKFSHCEVFALRNWNWQCKFRISHCEMAFGIAKFRIAKFSHCEFWVAKFSHCEMGLRNFRTAKWVCELFAKIFSC